MESEQLTLAERLMDAIEYALLVVDEKGIILRANILAKAQYGDGTDRLVGKSISDIITSSSYTDVIRPNTDLPPINNLRFSILQIRNENGITAIIDSIIVPAQVGSQKLFFIVWSPSDATRVEQVRMINQILAQTYTTSEDGGNISEAIRRIANSLAPLFTDWCGVYVIDPEGLPEQKVITPQEVLNNPAVYEWFENDLTNDEVDGLPAVLQSGRAKLVVEVNPMRRAAQAGITSYMIVPLNFYGKPIGASIFIYAESGRHFDQNSLVLAENLALHLAIHIKRIIPGYLETDRHTVSEQAMGTPVTGQPVDQSQAMLQTLFRISSKLNATLDVDVILDALAQEAIQMVGGESGFAGLRTSDGMRVKKYFQQGREIPFDHTWAIGEGIPGWVLKYKVPYGTSDAENDPLICRDLEINNDLRSVICTPILDTVGEVIAYFDIRNKQDSEGFSINDQEMLLTLAPVASIAIQNALAYQQRLTTLADLERSAHQFQELAASLQSTREEERINIARELHDQLGQSLTGIKFDLAWISTQIGQKDETLGEKTKDILAQLNNTIVSVRQIAAELRPGMLDDLGLAASVEWQVRDFERRSGIKCTISQLDDEQNLSSEQALAIYRILQEGLTNVAKHAETDQLDIRMIT
ncbi:MAG: GAF domain-containing protein, partial [Anaerolineae bacterium]|nr:GAF domain-containing protein [Anaerolineae bacterium]